jgi:hypothetical protein
MYFLTPWRINETEIIFIHNTEQRAAAFWQSLVGAQKCTIFLVFTLHIYRIGKGS